MWATFAQSFVDDFEEKPKTAMTSLMTPSEFDLRLRQMYRALEVMSAGDPLSVVPVWSEDSTGYSVSIDPNADVTDAELMTYAESLVSNIARLKDHLKVWCAQRSIQPAMTGDHLINSNLNVALVHDMWNIHKHGQLNSAPRSGHHPKIANLRKCFQLSSGEEGNSMVAFFLNPMTGNMEVFQQGGGAAALIVDGEVVDENGVSLGSLLDICQDAVQQWENLLRSAGVPIPM